MSFSNDSLRAPNPRQHRRKSYPTLWMALTVLAVLTVVSGVAYRRGDWTQTQTAATTSAVVKTSFTAQQSHGSTEPITTGSGGASNLSMQDKTPPDMQHPRGDVDLSTPR